MAFGKTNEEGVREYEEDFRRRLAWYDGRWMSNAKWLKVLTAIAKDPGDVEHMELKWIGHDHGPMHCWLFSLDSLLPKGLGDNNIHGPFEYREIEWLRWPRVYRRAYSDGYVSSQAQNVERLRDVILSVARAPLVLDDTYLWLIAYSPRKRPRGYRKPDTEYVRPATTPNGVLKALNAKRLGTVQRGAR